MSVYIRVCTLVSVYAEVRELCLPLLFSYLHFETKALTDYEAHLFN
jgi:hypothetical protein